jgi:hypothetical protein
LAELGDEMLTHTEAAILRAINDDVFTGRYIGGPEIGSPDLAWAIEDFEAWCLTPAGTAALAKYDAHFVTVPRAAVKGLYDFCMALTCPDPVSAELDELEPFVGR